MEALPKMTRPLASKVYLYLIPEPFRPKLNKRRLSEAFPKPDVTPSQDWAFIEDLHTEIRIWYLKNDNDQFEMAKKIRTYLTDEIIPAEKTLMGRAHLRDDTATLSFLVDGNQSRTIPNGGDGKLDIYIFNIPQAMNAKAYVSSYGLPYIASVQCPSAPTFMAFNLSWGKTATAKQIASTLSHEYFHVLQYTYHRKKSCSDYQKMDEGTATYLKQYVYPKYNDEHDWFQFVEDGSVSLITAAYESWIFYYWLVEMQGKHIMPRLYTTMEQMGGMDSVNAVLDGGFKKQWVEYLNYEWNQEPLQDGFKFWDNFTPVPGRGQIQNRHLPPIPVENVDLDENGQYRKVMDLNLKPLTRDYYAFKMRDRNIRSIAIENPVFWQARKVRTKVMVLKKGATSFEELLWEDNGDSP